MAFWKRTYIPPRGSDRLAGHGDYAATRARFLARPHSNLRFLVRERYAWMNPYLEGRERVVELGAGPGLSREFLRAPGLEVTDVLANPWIDRRVDAMALPYAPGSIDAIICSHMIHHVPRPVDMLRGVEAALRPGGLILINEANASVVHRLLMWVMRHEGWDYAVDIFGDDASAKQGADPLAGNNAVADLLFNDRRRFAAAFPTLSIIRDEYTELFLFLLSGGVGGQVFTVELPAAALGAVRRLDAALAKGLPGTFALGRRLVIVKAG
jgi:SAM-dependent methyltransferase